jgi:hypothetical protein
MTPVCFFGRSAAARVILALVSAAAVSLPASAQYRDAGTDVEVLPSRKEQLDEAVEQARWRLGRLHVAPYIGIRDVSYVRGESSATGAGAAAGETSDLTATLGAGLRLYLPMSKSVLAAHAIPEYSWWREQDERNAVIGRYGVGFFGFFNRLETELTARRIEEVGFLSPDLLVLQPVRTDAVAASAQVRLGAATALFVGGDSTRARVDDPEGLSASQTSEILDRDETSWRAGARYLLRGDLGHIGGGVQSDEVDFLDRGELRSNEGTGWYAEAQVRGNQMTIDVDYSQVELEAKEGGTFPGYDTGTGSLRVSYHPRERLQTHVYARRDLRYSAVAIERFFEEERLGTGLTLGLGRGTFLAFYEVGENLYFGANVFTPAEDVTAYGATLDLPFFEYLTVRIGGRTTRFEPEVGPEREVREVLGAIRLTLGSSTGEW